MKYVVDKGWDHILGPWWAERAESTWVPGKGHAIGIVSEERGIVAVGFFDSCNGASVLCHIASEGNNWMTRDFLWYFFWYPFEELKVKKLIAPIDSSNLASIKLAENIGFSLEATLKDACPKGDMLIYSMEKTACRWLNLKGRTSGQAQSTSTS